MSFENLLGVMSEGFYNESGDVYLRFESLGLIGTLGGPTPIPVPPLPGPPAGGMGNQSAFDYGVSPLQYYQRRKLLTRQPDVWVDTTKKKKRGK
jgi:hypothetical protein